MESGYRKNPVSSTIPSHSVKTALNPEQSRKIYAKITWRLIPLMFICYIIAYIDRINVGFAKLQLQEVLGVDDRVFGSVYGLGAGLFFIGYFLFEVPSNLILQRVGAKIWIARIMIVWGVISASMIFIGSKTGFYLVRFLLGIAEAGFYPGMILYLTYWFPDKERAHTVALFATGTVVAGIVGSPLSGAILELNGFSGLEGWQWLFLLEGIPAVLMGLVVILVLPDRPLKAKWLSPEEKEWIQSRLDEEAFQSRGRVHLRLSEVFISGRIWLLCFIYFLLTLGIYGYEMWLPSIIKEFYKQSYSVVGLINSIPYLVSVVVMLLIGYHSDKTGERRWHVAIAAFAAAAGFGLSAWLQNPYLAMIALMASLVGLKSAMGPFWALSTTFLGGTAAAGGIALINSVGNLGGFAGPTLVGVMNDRTGNIEMSLWILGGALLLMGILVLAIRSPKPIKEE
ncbi:MAG: MFS transporter [Bacteroidales bacterium]|nr:MFS transporter [Bacteroidales bacterium]